MCVSVPPRLGGYVAFCTFGSGFNRRCREDRALHRVARQLHLVAVVRQRARARPGSFTRLLGALLRAPLAPAAWAGSWVMLLRRRTPPASATGHGTGATPPSTMVASRHMPASSRSVTAALTTACVQVSRSSTFM